ncbi:MAG: hypothetical protein KIT85_20330 [Pseudolabrys sp.]|nr:hypothetical protein [Pseudolabrys sp.]
MSRDFTVVSASTNAGTLLNLPQDQIVGAAMRATPCTRSRRTRRTSRCSISISARRTAFRSR